MLCCFSKYYCSILDKGDSFGSNLFSFLENIWERKENERCMMKKQVYYLIVLALLFAIAGCGNKDAATDSREISEEDKIIQSVEETDVQNTPTSLSESDIQITRQDLSIKSEDGTTLISIYYDLVQLPDTNDAFRAVNASFQEEFDRFKSIQNEIRENGYDTIAENSYLQSGNDWHPFEDTYSADISFCADGILSIIYDTTWNMGGVGNTDRYGLVYNYITGKKFSLEALEKDLPQNVNLKEYVDSKVVWYLEENQDSIVDAVSYLDNCTLRDCDICIEEKQIILLTHNYTVTRGPRQIPLSLYIDDLGSENTELLKDTQWEGINRASLAEAYYMPIMSLKSDGSFSLWGAYSASDAGYMLEGTYTLNTSGNDILAFKGTRTADFEMNWKEVDMTGTYQVACIGDCIQLTQVDEDLMYYSFPAGTVWTFKKFEQ